MISTRDLRELPGIVQLRRLTRSLAMLDAILSPEWQYRYYSFNSAWAENQLMASMRNGSGDHWFAIFCPAGVALHGLAHEAPTFRPGVPMPGIFERLPQPFHANLLHEPAFGTSDSTFCIWRLAGDEVWSSGPVLLPDGQDPDGSAALLQILAGDPKQYVAFAAEYYDRDIDLDDVAAIYRHAPLDAELVRRLNPDVELPSLADDVTEIGYPETR
jgi:hypothetical protein